MGVVVYPYHSPPSLLFLVRSKFFDLPYTKSGKKSVDKFRNHAKVYKNIDILALVHPDWRPLTSYLAIYIKSVNLKIL